MQYWCETQLMYQQLQCQAFKNPCLSNSCRSINRASCSSNHTDASLSSCSRPTCHSGPAQTTQVIAEHPPARPRCSPAADWGKAWHVQSERQHLPRWPTPAFTAAPPRVPSHCIHTATAKEENILMEVVGSQPPPVKLSGSHMALAGDEEKTCTWWSCWVLLEPDGNCGGGCYWQMDRYDALGEDSFDCWWFLNMVKSAFGTGRGWLHIVIYWLLTSLFDFTIEL